MKPAHRHPAHRHPAHRQIAPATRPRAVATRTESSEQPRAYLRVIMGMSALAMLVLTLMMMAPAYAAGTDSGSGSSGYQAPKSDSPTMRTAIAAIKAENYETALGHLKTEIKANPKNADAWNLTGYASRKLGRYDDSAAAYDRALAINPKHKGALEYKGELFLTLGQLDAAEAMLARLKTHCSFNCAEVKTLTKAIAAYKKAQ